MFTAVVAFCFAVAVDNLGKSFFGLFSEGIEIGRQKNKGAVRNFIYDFVRMTEEGRGWKPEARSSKRGR